MNSLIKNLDSLSIEDLRNLDQRVEIELRRRRKDAEHALMLIASLFEPRTKRGAKKGSKVAPKYFGPNGETWSGRGLRPKWLEKLIANGASIDEFAA